MPTQQPVPVRDSDNVVRLLCLVGAARWQDREANPAFWEFADAYFGEATSKLLPTERDLPEKVFIRIEDMCKSALVGTPLGEKLYGAGHPYNELPLDIIIDLAIRESLDLWKRGVKRFPERCSYDYLYGSWLFSCFYHLRNLEKNGVEPSREALLRVLGSKTEEVASGNGGAKMAAKKNSAMQVFQFESNEVRAFMKDSEIWWVAKDVCEVLDIRTDTVNTVLEEDEFSNTNTIGIRIKGVNRGLTLINEPGLYSLILRSRKPQAKAFKRWVTHEVLPTIRKTGSFDTPAAKAKKADSQDELAWKRLEVMEKNANWRIAKLLLQGIDAFKDVMTEESKTVFMAKYGELLTDMNLTYMLPQATDPMYSATDIGNECGVSPQKIGKVANEHGLKSPQGETGEYGTWIRTKSPHSSKEVISFVYNEKGREWFLNFFGVLVKAQ